MRTSTAREKCVIIDYISIAVWKVKSQLSILTSGGKSMSSETCMGGGWMAPVI